MTDDWDDDDAYEDFDDPDTPDEVIECPECGGDIYGGSDHCPKCGHWLTDEDLRQMGRSDKNPSLWMKIIGIASLILIILGVAGFLISSFLP